VQAFYRSETVAHRASHWGHTRSAG